MPGPRIIPAVNPYIDIGDGYKRQPRLCAMCSISVSGEPVLMCVDCLGWSHAGDCAQRHAAQHRSRAQGGF